ncbi:hypothetical protein ACFFWC_14940 [Plantactinospora siamensis]|uniref:Uncharacterized protein n=1 Tax=Plantactinospora siamensis TaxID=555372 RepID=A0ABV6P1S7_9ACTN
MTTDTAHTDTGNDQHPEGERGMLLAMLVMVLLGVAGIFVAT